MAAAREVGLIEATQVNDQGSALLEFASASIRRRSSFIVDGGSAWVGRVGRWCACVFDSGGEVGRLDVGNTNDDKGSSI